MYIRATSPDTSIRRRRDVGPTLPSRAWPAAGALYPVEARTRDARLLHATQSSHTRPFETLTANCQVRSGPAGKQRRGG